MKRLVFICFLLFGLTLPLGATCFGQWQSVFVDQSNCVAIDPRIALDIYQNPHITHYDASNQALKYVYFDNAAWHNAIVDAEGMAGQKSGIALDGANQVHVSYVRNGSLMYALKADGVWSLETIIPTPGSSVASTAIALDAAGNPHLAYAVGMSAESDLGLGVYYVHWDGAAWLVEPVGMRGCNVSIGLDSLGNPYLAFITPAAAGASFNQIVCVRRNGGNWVPDYFDPEATVSGDTGLAVDPGDRVHVVYRDWPNGRIRYALFDGANWAVQTVAEGVGQVEGVKVDVNAQGQPHIAYNNGTGEQLLMYAYWTDIGWASEIIAAGGNLDITLDVLGRPHVAHSQSAEGRIPLPWPIENCEVLKYSLRR